MSTHCNYIFSDYGVTFYRHYDGYPSTGGLDLATYLLDYGNNISKFEERVEVEETDDISAHYEYIVQGNTVAASLYNDEEGTYEDFVFTFQEFENYCLDRPLDYQACEALLTLEEVAAFF